MTSVFFRSMILFSLMLGWDASADGLSPEEQTEEAPVAEAPEQKEEEAPKSSQTLFPKKTAEQQAADEAKAQSQAAPKKLKPQYAGAKRAATPDEAQKKPSRKVKNDWFSSKTQPKVKKKLAAQKTSDAAPKDPPWYKKGGHEVASLSDQPPSPEAHSPNGEEVYPRTGFQAPRGQVMMTGEWLYWRTRQEGMEFATSKQIEFEFQSGYRVGFGVHLPSFDGWCIYANYTSFNPEQSHTVHGSFYPLFLFQGSNPSHGRGPAVAKALGHWKIDFQTFDVTCGRPYFLSKRLVFSPFFGLRGAWIEQHAHFHYEGGFIPARKTWRTHFRNDFKGGGPLAGTEMNWQLGAGFSLFGDIAAALIAGQFDVGQRQYQLDGREVVHLDNDFNLISPTLQMVAGIAWDRNFNRDKSHFGLSAGFETQYWWSQNQTEQFTNGSLPTYVRQRGDLAFYGLTLRARFDL